MHTIYKLPNACFRHVNFFEVPNFGCPSLRSPYFACCSALFRTAVKTIPHWQKWMKQLRVIQFEVMPFEYVKGDGKLCSSWWDSQPLVCNLEEAFLGFPHLVEAHKGGSSILEKFSRQKDTPRVSSVPPPGDPIWSKGSVQKTAYSIFVRESRDIHCQATSIFSLMKTRLPNILKPLLVNPDLELIFHDICKDFKGSDKLKLIKTYTNAWVSSHRMHEDTKLDCFFGCPALPDKLEHYLFCPNLRGLMTFLVDSTSMVTLVRWGLCSPCTKSLQGVCCAYTGYHACKSQVRSRQIPIHITDNRACAPLSRIWTTFAEAFRAEAAELGLHTRSFSVPSFLDWMVRGSPVIQPSLDSVTHSANSSDAVPPDSSGLHRPVASVALDGSVT